MNKRTFFSSNNSQIETQSSPNWPAHLRQNDWAVWQASLCVSLVLVWGVTAEGFKAYNPAKESSNCRLFISLRGPRSSSSRPQEIQQDASQNTNSSVARVCRLVAGLCPKVYKHLADPLWSFIHAVGGSFWLILPCKSWSSLTLCMSPNQLLFHLPQHL